MALKRNSGKCRKKKTERLGHYKKTEKPYENKQGEVKHSLTITVKQKPAPESSQVKRPPPPPRLHYWLYYSKGESVGSCRFQIHLCIFACVMSREFTRKAVTKLLPAGFPSIWCKCLLWNLTHSKIFNLTKYREVLVKFSLLITHEGMPIWI